MFESLLQLPYTLSAWYLGSEKLMKISEICETGRMELGAIPHEMSITSQCV